MTREEIKDFCDMKAQLEPENEDIYKEIVKMLEQEPKSEWQKDHDILKAYSDGANEVIDKIRAEIGNHCGLTKEKHCRYCSYCHSVMGVREILEIIDKIQGRK